MSFPVTFTSIVSRRGHVWIGTTSGLSSSMYSRAPVIHLENKRDSWVAQQTPAMSWITSIQFLDDSTGWAGTDRGIMHTTDGGVSWFMQLPLGRDRIRDICVGTNCLWAVTSASAVYRYGPISE